MSAPNDLDLEFGCCSTILNSTEDATALCKEMQPDVFYSLKCSAIFRAASAVNNSGGNPTDLHEIKVHLQAQQGIGREIQLSELMRIRDEYPVFAGLSGPVARLQELSRLRKLQSFTSEVNRRITTNPDGVFDYATESLLSLTDGSGAFTQKNNDFFIHVADMKDTLPEWLIKGVIEGNCLTNLFGPVGSLKTFLAIVIALCIASGKDFYGNKVKDTGPVLFIIGEGLSGFKRRLKAWCLKHGVDLDSLPVLVSRQPAQMTLAESVADIKRSIKVISEKYGPPKLIVIDTLNRNFGPGDENSTSDMTTYNRGCDALRAVCGSTILTVHHSGLAEKERARGSVALFGSLDYCYRIDMNKDETINLIFLKCKDQPKPGPRTFAKKVIDLGIRDDEGEPVTSCILEEVALNVESGKDRRGRGGKQKIMQGILDEMVNDRDADLLSMGEKPEGRIPEALWTERCREAGCTRSDISRNKSKFIIQDGFVYSKLYA